MISIKDSLPKLDGMTSRAILFVVNGKRDAGHYHSNGFFYCDEIKKGLVSMAYGPDADRERVLDLDAVTEWEYLRNEEAEKPMSEFTLRMNEDKAERTSYFTVGKIVKDNCASLDILTPMHNVRFSGLSEGEQILLYSIVERMANYPVGSNFAGSWIPVNARQSTRSHVSAVLSSLMDKRVLRKDADGYRLLNPGFELWMRCRSLQMKGYYEVFGNAICPVLLKDDKMSPKKFWMQLCKEANVMMTELPHRRQSPPVDTQDM